MNMLSPWGHHLLGHHYLDMLLALHTRLFLPLSHLDLQVDLLCESCQQFFSRLDQADYLASSLNLNLRFVSLCFPERSPSTEAYRLPSSMCGPKCLTLWENCTTFTSEIENY